MKIIPTNFYLRKASKLFSEKERKDIETSIANEPEKWPVISGTGGLRKARVNRRGMGKSGGARTIYYYWVSEELILLVHVYAKNKQEDLTPDDKKILKQTLQIFKESYNDKKNT